MEWEAGTQDRRDNVNEEWAACNIAGAVSSSAAHYERESEAKENEDTSHDNLRSTCPSSFPAFRAYSLSATVVRPSLAVVGAIHVVTNRCTRPDIPRSPQPVRRQLGGTPRSRHVADPQVWAPPSPNRETRTRTRSRDAVGRASCFILLRHVHMSMGSAR